MNKHWLIYFLVSLCDLYLTILFLEPNTEGNPIASKVWSAFGLKGIIFYKTFMVLCVVYPICRYIEKKNDKAAKTVVSIGIVFTSITCLLFGVMIL